MNNLSEKARELKNAYHREWKRKNPEKVRKYYIDFWERKAAGYSVIQKVRDLSLQGFTQREIAKQLNIALGTVNKYLNKG
jgi:DNA invertase Pin-like site-specific DNA recombinase